MAIRARTLPPSATVKGRDFTVIKTDASANTVTLDGNAAETINGSPTYTLSAAQSTVTVRSTGSGWLIVASRL
jgi:hypothetical protein